MDDLFSARTWADLGYSGKGHGKPTPGMKRYLWQGVHLAGGSTNQSARSPLDQWTCGSDMHYV